MTQRKRRGPPPNPNSPFHRKMTAHERIGGLADDLVKSLPLASLPEVFALNIIEARIPADVTGKMRRAVCLRYLRNLGCVRLGGHTYGTRQVSLWTKEDC